MSPPRHVKEKNGMAQKQMHTAHDTIQIPGISISYNDQSSRASSVECMLHARRRGHVGPRYLEAGIQAAGVPVCTESNAPRSVSACMRAWCVHLTFAGALRHAVRFQVAATSVNKCMQASSGLLVITTAGRKIKCLAGRPHQVGTPQEE